jgi:gliding motility-associated-like protein
MMRSALIIVIFPFVMLTHVLHARSVITFQPSDSCGKDALIANLWPDNNYGTHADFIACAWTNQSAISNMRALIEFDIASIPAGAVIINAKLDLYHYTSPFNIGHSNMSGPADCWLERITQSWTESGVTWNNQPATTALNRVNVVAPLVMNQNYTLNVTLLLQDMLNNPATSYGFMLRLQNESYYRSLLFASSDASNSSFHPKLTVEYDVPILPLAGCWNSIVITPDSVSGNPVIDPLIAIPNVFTPNSDGTNDFFFPDTSGGIIVNELSIYDRWGILIYQSIPAQPWNGKFDNKDCSDGTYYYLIVVALPTGSRKELSGYVTLIR